MKATCVIPARVHGSKRFPRKVLQRIPGGNSLVAITALQALKCSAIDRVVVATDDVQLIRGAFNGGSEQDSVLLKHVHVQETSMDVSCGTWRAHEALQRMGLSPELVVNWQCDEPDVCPNDVDQLIQYVSCFGNVGTLGYWDPKENTVTNDPNAVKFHMRDWSSEIIAWYRSIKEFFPMGPALMDECPYPFYHIGIYAFKWELLDYIVRYAPEAEFDLEQTRWGLMHIPTNVVLTNQKSMKIDTPEEFFKWVEYYNERTASA